MKWSLGFRPLAGIRGLRTTEATHNAATGLSFRPLAGIRGLRTVHIYDAHVRPDRFPSPCGD